MTDKPVFVMPDLSGPQGNAFYLLGRASALLKGAGYTDAKRQEFLAEARSGDYDHLLETIRNWFRVAHVQTKLVFEEEEEN